MNAGEVERRWGRDRASLAACAGRHAALAAWRRNRDAGVAGETLPQLPKDSEGPALAAPAASAFSNPFAVLFGADDSQREDR